MSVKNSLVEKEKRTGEVDFIVDGLEVKMSPAIVRKYLVNGSGNVTDQEVAYYIQLCKTRKLNPFTKDCYLIKYGNQAATMVVAKDALERRAVKNDKYNGKRVGIYVTDENGELIKKENCILLKNEDLVGAWCEIFRKDWKYPVKIDVNFEEYIGRKGDGSLNTNWANKPVTMITKVAKAQALREAFIEEMSGMCEAEEVEKNVDFDNIPEATPVGDVKFDKDGVIVEEKPPVENETKDESIADIFNN